MMVPDRSMHAERVKSLALLNWDMQPGARRDHDLTEPYFAPLGDIQASTPKSLSRRPPLITVSASGFAKL